MKRTLLILLLTSSVLISFAQHSREEYILKYQSLAIKEMGRSGIPASITMAQAVLESNNGNSELSKQSNNHFGIKCKSNWNGKRVYYDDDARGECFRQYKCIEDSYIDHSNFLMNNPRYGFLFNLNPHDYKGWAKGLKSAGYATARHYDKTLIKIIEDYKLYRLDYKQSVNLLESNGGAQQFNSNMSDHIQIDLYGKRKTININGLKAVAARKDDTYEIIAKSLGIEAWELYSYNDRYKGYIPHINEVVYIKPKYRRAKKQSKHFHTTAKGETMHYISQLYGLKLKPLYRRNRMKRGEEPKIGEIIYLRKKRPSK